MGSLLLKSPPNLCSFSTVRQRPQLSAVVLVGCVAEYLEVLLVVLVQFPDLCILHFLKKLPAHGSRISGRFGGLLALLHLFGLVFETLKESDPFWLVFETLKESGLFLLDFETLEESDLFFDLFLKPWKKVILFWLVLNPWKWSFLTCFWNPEKVILFNLFLKPWKKVVLF